MTSDVNNKFWNHSCTVRLQFDPVPLAISKNSIFNILFNFFSSLLIKNKTKRRLTRSRHLSQKTKTRLAPQICRKQFGEKWLAVIAMASWTRDGSRIRVSGRRKEKKKSLKTHNVIRLITSRGILQADRENYAIRFCRPAGANAFRVRMTTGWWR